MLVSLFILNKDSNLKDIAMKEFIIISSDLCVAIISATSLSQAMQQAREQGLTPIYVRQGN